VHEFLSNNRDELIARCKRKVEQRPKRAATTRQLANGIPLFLEQLTRTLRAEEADDDAESLRISGPSGGDMLALSEMGVTAIAHGKELLEMGYAVDQVVHDYGDLCQSITDLAFERDAPFAIDEFRTLNRCLDNAIADAVTEFTFQRDATLATQHNAEEIQRAGFLVHELRNSLSAANLALRALEVSNMPVSGATGALLKRSLAALGGLISGAVNDVRSRVPDHRETLSVASFIADAKDAGQLQANAKGCVLEVQDVDATLGVRVDRDLLLAALANLLQNAFKFTHAHTGVKLRAYALGGRVLVEVTDHCGGLLPGSAEKMFTPFAQHGDDRSGLGLGLFIARRSVEADAGTLSVRDVPGTGCVFTISLPRYPWP
jgi:signal transduction histidine kinase